MYWNVSRFSFRTNLNRLVVVWHDSFSGLLLFWATCGVALAWRFSSHVFYIQFLRLRQAVPDIALYTYIYNYLYLDIMINKYDNGNQTYTHMINNNISNTDEDLQFTHHPSFLYLVKFIRIHQPFLGQPGMTARTHDSNGWKGGLVTLVGQGAYMIGSS